MALIANSSGQRAVMVNSTNSVLLYPNNFWSVNASAARNGIGLSLPALTNTNTDNFRNGIGLGATWLTNTNVTNFRTAINLGWSALTNSNAATSLLGFTTNGTVVANTTNVLTLTNLVTIQAPNNADVNVFTVIGGGDNGGSGDQRLVIRNGTVSGTNSLVPAGFDLTYGGLTFSSAFAKTTTRTNLGLGATWLTNTNVTNFRTDIGLGATWLTNTNVTNFRTDIGLGTTWLTNTNATNFRTDVGLGQTNSVTFSEVTVTNTFYPPTFSPTNLLIGAGSLRMTGSSTTTRLVYKLLGATPADRTVLAAEDNLTNLSSAATARTNLGLGATWLTNTNVTNFRTDVGLGWSALTNSNAATSLIGFTTNGQVVANTGTNMLTFTNTAQFNGGAWMGDPTDGILIDAGDIFYATNIMFRFGSDRIQARMPIEFPDPNGLYNQATTRTNLGLGATWLTNTNSTNFRTSIGLGATWLTNTNTAGFNTSLYGSGTNPVLVSSNGVVVSPTNFWQVAPIQTLVQDFTLIGGTQTNNASNARTLYVYSLNTNLINGISNTIILPTNSATFVGDEATVIHRGNTNTTTVIRQAGSTNNLITLSRFDEAVKFIKAGEWEFYHNISYVEAIQFSGTNASNNIAATRTNLGLPLPALTNSNTTNFQAAVFQTNTTPAGANFANVVAWMEVNVITNGSNTSFRIPLFK